MSAHAQDPIVAGDVAPAAAPSDTAMSRTRPRWLVPAVIIALIAGGLVITGTLPPTVILYAGLLGGCALMHLFGHGKHR
jgi:hypothetical protein